jgi:hypothetical protein
MGKGIVLLKLSNNASTRRRLGRIKAEYGRRFTEAVKIRRARIREVESRLASLVIR